MHVHTCVSHQRTVLQKCSKSVNAFAVLKLSEKFLTIMYFKIVIFVSIVLTFMLLNYLKY